ncbi:MAG: RluA family pseudouridine synthase [Planctomycetes bacterium]|nr:RluA family pseudouridine synthase [Planctomycetota bacterium]
MTSTLVLTCRIPADARGKQLIDYLAARFRYHDVAGWRRELAAGRLLLGDKPARGDEQLRTGMRLSYRKQHREPPVDDRFTVLHRDAALVAVDKPAHLPVHADGPFQRHTLIALLRERLDDPELQLPHRLDRETSGVCLVARDKTVQAAIQAQFAAGTVHKVYLAVVDGHVEAPFVADQPIGLSPDSEVKIRRSAAPDATATRPARTRFTPLRRGPRRSLVQCEPETGRTHQIRVHLEAFGHPVLGDKLYGRADADYLAFVHRSKAGHDVRLGDPTRPDLPHRQLLHAWRISLQHPTTGEQVTYEAPLPEEFERWLQA